MPKAARAFAKDDPRQARVRLLWAGLTGLSCALAIPERFGLPVRLLSGWSAAAVVMGALAWSLIARSSAPMTRRYAAADDPGRTAVWIVVLIASLSGLFGSSIVLKQAHSLTSGGRDLFAALCVLAVASAWMLTHTAYTLRYAHLYYRNDEEGEGGLMFPGPGPGPGPGTCSPSYFDFAYFAFTIGMCFQVSDVIITSPQIRRTVLSHGILSFVYNTVILAVALNLVVGVFG